MSTSTPVRPSAQLPRAKRIENLARRAEKLEHPTHPTLYISHRERELTALVAEMAREMFRMAHALDGVV